MKLTKHIGMTALATGLVTALGFSGVTHAQFQDRNIRMSTGVGKQHPLGIAMVKMSQCLAEKSGGKFRQRNFNDNALGSDLAVSQQVRSGTIEIVAASTAPLVGAIPELAAFDLPFLLSSNAEVDAFFTGKVIDHFIPKYRAAGFEFLDYWEYGFRSATNSKRPITKWEDMQGLKMRVMQNKVYLDTFSAFGSNAIPMPFSEVYSALETKAVDGQENPISAIENMKFHEVQKYLSLTRHTYSPIVVAYSKRLFDQLSKDEQQAVRDCSKVGKQTALVTGRDMEAKSLAQMQKEGIVINEIPPAELQRMRDRVKPVWDSQVQAVGAETMNLINSELKRIRGQ